MMSKIELRRIIKKALKIRAKENIELDSSFCIIDLAGKLGLEVRFVDLSSMEGAYLKDSKVIMLSTLRPEGRIRFTCAHELAHHVYNHGDHFDELVENVNTGENNNNELISDTFASFLLMPETTVRSGFINRSWDFNKPSPLEIYTVSSWLGVGYTTLINHMYYSLRLLNSVQHKDIIKVKPKMIKKEICGFEVTSNLIVLDKYWKGRPIDLQVGDYLVSDKMFSIEDKCMEPVTECAKEIYVAQKPGLVKIASNDDKFGALVRIRRREYTGRASFRHLEED